MASSLLPIPSFGHTGYVEIA